MLRFADSLHTTNADTLALRRRQPLPDHLARALEVAGHLEGGTEDVHRARPSGVVVGEVSREVEGFAQQADRLGGVGVERDTRESRQRERLERGVVQRGCQVERLAEALGCPVVLPGPEHEVAMLVQGQGAGGIGRAGRGEQPAEPVVAVGDAVRPQPERDQRVREAEARVHITVVEVPLQRGQDVGVALLDGLLRVGLVRPRRGPTCLRDVVQFLRLGRIHDRHDVGGRAVLATTAPLGHSFGWIALLSCRGPCCQAPPPWSLTAGPEDGHGASDGLSCTARRKPTG